MRKQIGIIGVGHLARYLVTGLYKLRPEIRVVLSPRKRETAMDLASQFEATVAGDNQAVVDESELVLLTTRSEDARHICDEIAWRCDQTVISTAPGVEMSHLRRAIQPASAVRAMPISCAAIHRSPTLIYPDHPAARELFELLGEVHPVADESIFIAGAVIAAFYGWIFALMDETTAWCVQAGVPGATARNLVLETVRGAAEIGLAEPERELSAILETLTTAGGITEQGLGVIQQRGGLAAWVEALEAAHDQLRAK